MNAPNPRQLEQESSIRTGLEEALRASEQRAGLLKDAINPGFLGVAPREGGHVPEQALSGP